MTLGRARNGSAEIAAAVLDPYHGFAQHAGNLGGKENRVFALFADASSLPPPFDAESVKNGFSGWYAAAESIATESHSDFIHAFAEDEAGRAFLTALFGNSPYLARNVIRDPGFVHSIATRRPEISLQELFGEVRQQAREAGSTANLMAVLRQGKTRLALLTAAADLAGAWSLAEVTAALSGYASLVLDLALEHLLRMEASAGNFEIADPDDPCRSSGLTILGMGKLGADELNYSSDIDLIVLWDQEVDSYVGTRGPQDGFVRLTRDLVKIIQDRTGDGYVFRTDLRLRPDAGATPVALSMAAAENYYESVGQNWERAAMIKARPVAGDIEAGAGFLQRISPFIWRKFLDFAAIEDIHSIKRQIHAHKGHRQVTVPGHNIKVGRGGIREIEFFAQTQQLIAGGRDPTLRQPGTCAALTALAESEQITSDVAAEMIDSYGFLRRLEHRLQMIADEQTQTLPEDPEGLAHVAAFSGYDDVSQFEADVLRNLERVQNHYARLFEDAPDLGAADGVAGNLVFTGTEDDPGTIETLASMGYREPATAAAAIRRWHHGRYRATRSVRARELLTELMPILLATLADTLNPDAALLKFDEFLGKLPSGVQLFSLFHAHPGLLSLVGEIMGGAPRLAEYLSRNPSLLDGVISPGFYDPLPDANELRAELEGALSRARDIQDVLDVTRRWSHGRRFQVGVQNLRHLLDANAAGPGLADLADVPIRALLGCVSEELAERHGVVPGGEFVVIAMGKLGAREMTAGSDLDLTFVYDHPDDVSASDGERPLSVTEYYARLAKRLINALNAMTGEGRLYDVDMRLRPSGAAGPIAVRLDGFSAYQKSDAWTWEHMALVRARTVAGPENLAQQVEQVIGQVLSASRDEDKLLKDVAEMRERIERDRPTANPWSVKYVRGGIVDLEFIAQYLVLRHAHEHPEVIDGNTSGAFERLRGAGLLDQGTAADLVEAIVLMRNVQGLLRQTTSDDFADDNAPEGLRAALAAAVGEPDFSTARARLIDTQAVAFGHFKDIIAEPAGQLDEPNKT